MIHGIQVGYGALRCFFAMGGMSKWIPETSTSKVILAFDAVSTLEKAHQVVVAFKNEQISLTKKYVALAGMVSTTIAAFFIQRANNALTSQIDLSKVLEGTSNLTASWVKPRVATLICGFLVARVAMNVALVIFTSPKSLGGVSRSSRTFRSHLGNLLEVVLQTVTWSKTSKIQWLHIVRTDSTPFATMHHLITAGEDLKDSFRTTTNKIQTTFCLKVSNFDESALRSAVDAIYKYSHQMFDKSAWSRYWRRPNDYASRFSEKSINEFFDLMILGYPLRFKNVLVSTFNKLTYNVTLNGDNRLPLPPCLSSITAQLLYEGPGWVLPSGGKTIKQEWLKSGFSPSSVARWFPINFVRHVTTSTTLSG